ncbi:hypothetical protein GCM10009527_024020 [Actinomadura nitritigenes]|uniref:Secreted protein n=1 Tax=Actinomadura nitritigenes TaxID=134602 RepID=A0ABS3RD71_9ACTN|nr:hypothetical protein [Actinomadura nitritigenes]MBO2444163.1 hypothetical protein [Actinomadura nitritigenes]
MRSRISGRGLLPAALAAASVVAVAAPASAQKAPPPGPATSTTTTSTPADDGDCARGVRILSELKLLPNTPDLGRILCSANTAGKAKAPATGTAQAPATGNAQRPAAETADRPAAETATESPQNTQEYNLLGLPLEWPKSLTVHVPTLNDHWYVYKSNKQ